MDLFAKWAEEIGHPNALVVLFTGKTGSGKDYIINRHLLPLLKSTGLQPYIASIGLAIKMKALEDGCLTYHEAFVKRRYLARLKLQKIASEGRAKSPHHWLEKVHYPLLEALARGFDVIVVPDARTREDVDYFDKLFSRVVKVHVVAEKRAAAHLHNLVLEDCQDEKEAEKIIDEIKAHATEQPLGDKDSFIIDNDEDKLLDIGWLVLSAHLASVGV